MQMRDYLLRSLPNHLSLTEEQLDRFDLYFRLLTEWNEKINLTAITDAQGVAVKHFADSLSLLQYITLPQGASLIDVGTGAGFPGVVLKIARPDIRLTLLDSLKKRFLFLEDLMTALDLEADFVIGRAEVYGQNTAYRESYDYAVSRAVANLNTLSEYCLPLVRQGGSFIAFKGSATDEELGSAARAIQVLGGKLKAVHSFDLPFEGGARNLVEIKKVGRTPDKYPRNNGKIKSKPL